MGDRAGTRLPRPKTRGSDAFKAALDPLKTNAHFAQVGIGVIDFTRDHLAPDIWLFNEDKPYRIGSASKIAVLLAATQLRCDVRNILDLHPQIVEPKHLDALFANPKLWEKAKAPKTEMPYVRHIASNPPLISKIFDLAKSPVDFVGPDPNGRKDDHDKPVAAVQKAIFDQLPSDGELAWEMWSKLTFSERLWLAGCASDNVAATACLSELGVPYVKAVLRSYGLADHPDGGMHLLLSGGYSEIRARRKSTDAAPPRRLIDPEPITVEDYWWDPKARKFSDRSSHVPGSAAALTAYMIALMTNDLVNDGSLIFGEIGSTTIRKNLADGGPHDVDDRLIEEGILGVPGTTVTRQIDKIGLLQKTDKPPTEKAFLRCEFTYVETSQVPARSHGRTDMKYAIVATGVISEVDLQSPGPSARGKSDELGAFVHRALLTL
jgi:Beta-lactamase enzyme family